MRNVTLLAVLAVIIIVGGMWVWGGREVEVEDRAELTQLSCETAGGRWNGCGSACRETPEAACIQVCVAYCECASDAECPTGYPCGGYVEGVGVCQRS